MTHNQMIKCKYCDTNIRLRMQLGYFNIPFSFCCQKCKTHIFGKIILDQSKPFHEDERLNIEYELNNAEINKNIKDFESGHYIAEQSVEFPQKKIYIYNKEIPYDVTPFMRSITIFGENTMQITQEVLKFANFKNNAWKELNALYELFYNGKIDIVKGKISDISSRFIIKNELDIIMALHQMCVANFSHILPLETLSNYTDISKNIIDLFNNNHIKTVDYINKLEYDKFFEKLDIKSFKILNEFCNIFEKLIPVITLLLGEAFDKFDLNIYGISTVGFDELKVFYSNSYEFLLEIIDVIIGLNNILIRGDYNHLITNKYGITKYDELSNLSSKYNKIDFIDFNEPFSTKINFNNHIRNAIAHYNVEIDESSQKITFFDKHKGKENNVELYFIEFAKLCVENFQLIFYISELSYNLNKINFVTKGFRPNIQPYSIEKNDESNKKYHKIGPNEPCSCGSGKKFKNCCG